MTGTQNQDAKAFVWDADSRMREVWSQQNNNTYVKKAVYSYGTDGNRLRADQLDGSGNITKWREYSYANGLMYAEVDNDGNWTDYVYAGGKKIARVEESRPVIHLHGTQTQAAYGVCGTPWNVYGQASAALPYPVAAGDVLVWEQKANYAISGVALGFGNNVYVGADGAPPDGQWHRNTVSLNAYAGQTAQQLVIGPGNPDTPVGDYDAWLKNVVIQSTDGSVHPLFTGGAATGAVWGTCGNPNLGLALETTEVDSIAGTTYSVGDHLGTAQMDLTALGTPLWKGEFAPFGQELSEKSSAATRYKFTGKERDEETDFDYFGARYYASNQGRWISPDWAQKAEPIPYFKADDPQTLNLYQYVGDNPIARFDADGHCFWDVCISEAMVTYAVATVAVTAAAATAHRMLQSPQVQRALARTSQAVTEAAQKAKQAASRAATALALAAAEKLTPAAPVGATAVPTTASPALPTDLVGVQDGKGGPPRGRVNSGPLAPEHGGTGDATADFGRLTGGNNAPAPEGSGRPPGTRIGDNGTQLRPPTGNSGPRIDVPENGPKPPETLHYPR